MKTWSEDKKGKLIGAIALFLMYAAPMTLVTFLQEGIEFMGGNKSIKAVLKQDVSYNDLSGQARTAKAGEVVRLYIVKEGSTSADGNGRTTVQRKPSFIGIKGFDSFDLKANEFKTVD